MTTIRAEIPEITLRRGPTAATVAWVTAKVLLYLGLLVAGFIVYEFGVTSFFATRGQATLETQFEERVAVVETVPVAFTPAGHPEAVLEWIRENL